MFHEIQFKNHIYKKITKLLTSFEAKIGMGKNIRPGVRRKAERVKADYDIRQGIVKRREMEVEELRDLFIAVDQNILSKFGIVKLSTLDLDSFFPAPHRLLSPEEKDSFEKAIENLCLCDNEASSSSSSSIVLPPPSQHTTLLNYSAWMRRDQITYALLRAGADPTARMPLRSDGDLIVPPDMKRTIHGIFERIPPPYSVWILWKLSQLRQRGNELMEITGKEALICPLLHNFPLYWDSCGHMCCEHCLWELFVAKQHSEEGGFLCHHCFRRSFGDEIDLLEDMQSTHSTEKDDESSSSESSVALGRKKRSLLLYQSLPLDLVEHSSSSKKPKFSALPLLRVKESYLGIVQSTRSNEFLKAAIAGDVLRLRMIIFHGVDVDTANEYGETALLLAVFHNKPGAVRFLVEWAAANVCVPTYSGYYPISLALASPSHTQVSV